MDNSNNDSIIYDEKNIDSGNKTLYDLAEKGTLPFNICFP